LPAFRKIMSKHEYDHGEGFEMNVGAVAKLEKELGIYDLARFDS